MMTLHASQLLATRLTLQSQTGHRSKMKHTLEHVIIAEKGQKMRQAV